MWLHVRQLWIPSLVFTALTALVSLFVLMEGRAAVQPVIIAAVVTPLIWSVVVRPTKGRGIGRAAVAGALIVAETQLLPYFVLLGWQLIRSGPGSPINQTFDILGFFMVGWLACVAAVPGALCGALLALRRKVASPRAAETQ